MNKYLAFFVLAIAISSCSTNPYKASEKEYDTKLKSFKETISNKEARTFTGCNQVINNH